LFPQSRECFQGSAMAQKKGVRALKKNDITMSVKSVE